MLSFRADYKNQLDTQLSMLRHQKQLENRHRVMSNNQERQKMEEMMAYSRNAMNYIQLEK